MDHGYFGHHAPYGCTLHPVRIARIHITYPYCPKYISMAFPGIREKAEGVRQRLKAYTQFA